MGSTDTDYSVKSTDFTGDDNNQHKKPDRFAHAHNFAYLNSRLRTAYCKNDHKTCGAYFGNDDANEADKKCV